jgi:hypothetical protein
MQMPQMPRDKRAEFMRGHPLVFAHSADPINAKEWLCTVERELHTTQCNDREKVMYGLCLLRGATQSWWESYLATHANPKAITWEEFRDNFHRCHFWLDLITTLAFQSHSLSASNLKFLACVFDLFTSLVSCGQH